ncbi:MAG: sugar nucleotide-binding protein, partial [Muribaculaceae bacterium]|nr:sugar nucleotide-binding protein [Muribaculaceae bacterium]
MTNILITGGNGQLGNCLRIASKDSKDNYIFTDIADDDRTQRLDITDREAVARMVKDNDI